MKQKLGLATALVHRPQVLLLDEPTGGVDPVTRQDFWQLIIRLVAEDAVSVLVSTPYMDEAVRCSFVGFMQDGHLVVEDNPKSLRQRLEGRIVELRGEPLKVLRGLVLADQDVEGVQAFGDRLHLRTRPNCAKQVIARLENTIQSSQAVIHTINIKQPSLEDVFIELLEK
jgi:ABC-2 type transport system ATP-binding protein